MKHLTRRFYWCVHRQDVMDKHMDKHTDEEKITLECEGDGHQDGEEKNCQQRVYDHLRTCGFWVWSRILLPLGQRLGQLVQDLRQPVRDLGQLAWKGMKGPVPQVSADFRVVTITCFLLQVLLCTYEEIHKIHPICFSRALLVCLLY